MKFKRLLSCLVVFAFILSMLPMNVFAELGALQEVPANEIKYAHTTLNTEYLLYKGSTPKGTYHILFNDYITFILRPNGMTSTLPTRDIPITTYNNMQNPNGFAELATSMRQIPVTEQVTFYGAKGYQVGFDYKSGNAISTEKIGDNKLQAVYKIDTGETNGATITVTYEIVRVDRGTTDGAAADGIIDYDSSDNGRTWAVRATARANYSGHKLTDLSSGSEGYMLANFTMVTDHIGFAKNREDKSQGAIQYTQKNSTYNSDTREYTSEHVSAFWNSNTPMPKTDVSNSKGDITEFYTSSFGISNQFVAAGPYQGGWRGDDIQGMVQTSGPVGHGKFSVASDGIIGGNYGDYVSYSNEEIFLEFDGSPVSYNNELRVYSNILYDISTERGQDSKWTMDGLWGYRDLYKPLGGSSVRENITNFVEVKQGGHLGIVKDGENVYAIEGESIDKLKEAHGSKLLAVFRGNWKREGTDYVFSNNVALSSTVTATKIGTDSSFTVSENGTVTVNNMGISCPAFQFYTPKNGMGVSFDYQNSSNGVLNMVITPENNDSVLHLDIPGAQSVMDGVSIGLDGSLTFKGIMSINTPVLDIADITVNRIGMGYKGNNYTVKGIEASGTAQMPDILGMPSNGVQAYINTFDKTEKYEFKLNVEVPSLFETEAELTLVRLKNGAIAPDKLNLFVGGETGFPLVAPVVVAEITGAGGGFSNLADTVNGDFYAVPPLKLFLTGQAEVLQMLEGKATMTVGLGYYEKKLHDPEFFDLFGLDAEYSESTYFTGDKRDFKNKTFNGIAVGGSKRLEVHLPNEDVDIISISSGLSIDAFAGIAEDNNNTYVMLDLNGDGKIDGSLNFPKKIGKLKMPSKIAGKAISSTKLELALGLKTMFNLDDSVEKIVWNGVKNASGTATVSYSKKIFGCKLYVTAIFAKKNIKLGVDTWLGDIDTSFSWGKANNARLMSYGETDDMYYAMYLTSDIKSLGSTEDMQLMSINMDDEIVNQLAEAGIIITQNGDGENNYTVTIYDEAKTNQLLFTLTPKAEADEEALETMFTITKDESDYTLIFDDYDDEGESIVDNANAYVSAGGYDEASGEETNAAVVAQLLEPGTYTISASDAFDIEVLGFDLAEYIDTDGSVKELKDGRNYVVRTYLMDSAGEYHFVGEEAEATNDYNVTSAIISNTQDSVPSGTYTKVYRLLEKMSADESGDYYVTLDTYEGGEIEVTNPNEISAPTNVIAESVGSEILRASWIAPENGDIDGYSITIYEQNGNEWINTSTGYEVRADERGNIPTGIDMALTIGGDGDTDDDGTPNVENAVLEADKAYRISVAALSDITVDLDNDGEDETVAKRSAEVFSDENGVFIPKATPPELEYSPAPEIIEDSNMKTLYVSSGTAVTISSNPSAWIKVTNTHDNTEILSTQADVYATNFTVPEFEGSLIIQVDAKDADGDMTRDYITLKKDTVAPIITFDSESFTADDNGNFTITGTTETGVEFTVDNSYGYIKETELEEEPWSSPHYEITQGDDGSFTMTGELSEITKSGDDSIGGALIYMMAKDKAGNESEYVFANVTYEDDSTTVKVETPVISPNGGTFTGTKSVTISTTTDGASIYYTTDGTEPTSESTLYDGAFTISADTTVKAVAIKDGMTDSDVATAEFDKRTSQGGGGSGTTRYTVKFETDGGTEIANKTVTRNSKLAEPEVPTKDGYTFGGWYTDEELTEKYDFDSKVTKGFTLYAKWDKHDDETPVTPEWINPFEDVKESDWFFEDVKYANVNELMNGISETEFAPNDKLTRAMLVTVLYRLEGEPATNRSIPFADVDMGAYYANAVIWAKQNGIVNGVSETEFAPNDNITREQIAAIMHRYAQYKGIDVSIGENTNILSYDDFDSISEYAIASMQYACGSGLIKGKTTSTLNPLDNATRAEIAAILHRFIEANK